MFYTASRNSMNPTGYAICWPQKASSGALANFHLHIRCVMIKTGKTLQIKHKKELRGV
jgi:hypothetical protein